MAVKSCPGARPEHSSHQGCLGTGEIKRCLGYLKLLAVSSSFIIIHNFKIFQSKECEHVRVISVWGQNITVGGE